MSIFHIGMLAGGVIGMFVGIGIMAFLLNNAIEEVLMTVREEGRKR